MTQRPHSFTASEDETSLPLDELVVPPVLNLERRAAEALGDERMPVDLLVWQTYARRSPGRLRKAPPDLLRRFLQLDGASSERILDFAREFGPLRLCADHALPVTHSRGCRLALVSSQSTTFFELIDDWHHLVRQAKALQGIAYQLRQGARSEPEWAIVFEPPTFSEHGSENPWWNSLDLDGQKNLLSATIDEWIRGAAMRPYLRWGAQTEIALAGGGGFFGAVALQLLWAVAEKTDLTFCSACAQRYNPIRGPLRKVGRRPRVGERHYCWKCRKREIPVRDAQRDWRKRKKALGDRES